MLRGTLSPLPAQGCEAAVEVNPDGTWNLLEPTYAQGYISYAKGTERMIMAHGMGSTGRAVVSVSPIPSPPDRVKLDVLASMPNLEGKDLSEVAKSKLWIIYSGLAATQIYPLIPKLMFGFFEGLRVSNTFNAATNGLADGGDAPADVVVHQHLEKAGMTAELLTARTADGLYHYLRGKGLKIQPGAITSLNFYIGKDFSFLASWMSPHQHMSRHEEAGGDHSRGMMVTFPSADIYYPLIPTSIYGEGSHPETIVVMGLVSPRLFRQIKPYCTVTYEELGPEEQGSTDLKDALNSKESCFTKIEIEAPGKVMTEDLHMSSSVPVGARYEWFVANHPVGFGILVLLASSMLSGVLTGWTVYPGHRRLADLRRYAAIGCSNCFTFLAVVVVAQFSLAEGRTGYLVGFTLTFLMVSGVLLGLTYFTV